MARPDTCEALRTEKSSQISLQSCAPIEAVGVSARVVADLGVQTHRDGHGDELYRMVIPGKQLCRVIKKTTCTPRTVSSCGVTARPERFPETLFSAQECRNCLLRSAITVLPLPCDRATASTRNPACVLANICSLARFPVRRMRMAHPYDRAGQGSLDLNARGHLAPGHLAPCPTPGELSQWVM